MNLQTSQPFQFSVIDKSPDGSHLTRLSKGKEDKKPDSKDPGVTNQKSPNEKSEDSIDIPDELSAPMIGALHNIAFAALGEMLESNPGTTDEIFVLRKEPFKFNPRQVISSKSKNSTNQIFTTIHQIPTTDT